MKQQEKANEFILTFDDVTDMKLPWERDIAKLMATVEKQKKKRIGKEL